MNMTMGMTTEATDTSITPRAVAIWLFAVAALVALMIVVGGLTRLTESGLSMVEWKPVTGWLPPLSETAWVAEFEKYKQFPEYQKVNIGMTRSEEHTSELQSRENLVCRLLLEKKK